MPESLDTIIIGAGHNGLVTAAYLAKAGRRVLVLESRELVGGCAVTEEIWPGYKVSTASYLSSLMQEKVVRELELEKFGYRVDAKDPAFFSPFPDGRHLFMWQDRAKTLAEIAKFSPKDADAYPKYEAHLERLAIVAESLLLTTPPDFPPRGPGDYLEYLKLAGKLKGLSRDEIVGLVKIFTQSAADFLDQWFESDQLKVTLATDGVIGANGGPKSPGTAYILLHHCMGGVNGHRGLWGFVRGEHGRSLERHCRFRPRQRREDPHQRTRRENPGKEWQRQRRGPRIGRGNRGENRRQQPRSAADVSQIDGPLPPAARLPDRHPKFPLRRNVAQDEPGPERLSGVAAYPETPGPQHRATMHICPSVEYIERAWDDAKYGKPSQNPLIEMTIPTMYDPSLAPPGRHIMGIFLQYAPYTLKGTTWDDQREPYAERILDVIQEYCPNIRSIVVERQTLTPLDLERRFGITGGNIFHGEMSLDQMFVLRPVAGWAKYRTPIKGLYLCGSGAHPGGGVMGAPGHNAALAILKG